MAEDSTGLVREDWSKHAEPTPEWTVPASIQQWSIDRLKVRATLNELLGRLPPRPAAPRVENLGRQDKGDYWLEKFEFDNAAGSFVPGYLLLPKTPGPHPAILYCHWHGGEYNIGKEELFRNDKNFRSPGPSLVRRGFAVMAIDACCFGERNGRGPDGAGDKDGAGEMTASKYNLWRGRTLWGMILRDDLMALDYLSSRNEVDRNRIGVTGMSMGATRSWWLMALDDRILAGVAVACLTRYEDLIVSGGLRAHGIYYFVPGMLRHFDTEAVVSLIAPRPILFMNGDRDSGSPLPGIRKIEAKAAPFWKLYDATESFQSKVWPDTGHDYLPEMWDRTLNWLDRWLKAV